MGARLFESLLWVWSVLIVGMGINWFTDILKWTFLWDHPWETSAGFLLLGSVTLWSYGAYRFAEATKHFALCKEAKDLRPEDLDFRKQKSGAPPNPDYRPFNDTYIPRKAVASHATPRTASVSDAPMEEPMLVNLLRNGQGLVFVGPPGAGKTRVLFSLLRSLGPCLVLQPRRDQPVPPEDAFHFLKGRQVVVLLNDLDLYANHPPDLQEFCTKVRAHALSGGIAATCRDGKALGDLTGNSLRRLYENSLLPLTLVRLTQTEQQRLATSVNRPWRQDYATPGDIVMAEMRGIMQTRYDHDLSLDCQDVLQALKLLTAAKLALTTARLRVVMQHVFEKSPHLGDCLRLLADQSFLDKRSLPATIEPEPYYLDKIVPYPRAKDEPATDFPLLMLALEDLQDADGLYTLGRVFAEREDRMNAWACFGKVAALQADFPETLYTNADEAYDAARYHEALELYDYLLLLQPENYEVWYRKGNALYMLGRHEEALTAYDRALHLQPDSANAWTNKGTALHDLGRHREALTAYDRALQLQPNLAAAWGNKGNALSALGRHREALTAYDRALQLQPNLAGAWKNKGLRLADLGHHVEALTAFEWALQLQPGLVSAWYDKGNALVALGRHREALVAFERAVQLQSDYVHAWNHKGNALVALGRHREALVAFERAVQLQPDYATAWYNKGTALYDLGHHEEALAAHDRALQLQPDYAHAWNHKGNVLHALGHHVEALAAYNRSLQLQPDNVAAWSNKGNALSALGRHREALAAFDRTLQLQPNYAIAWNNKGDVLHALGRHVEALAAFERAAELKPDFIQPWQGVAWLAGAQGDLVKAEKARLEVSRLAREEREKQA